MLSVLAHSCPCTLFPTRGNVCSQQISISSERTTFFRQSHGAKCLRNKSETAQKKYQSLRHMHGNLENSCLLVALLFQICQQTTCNAASPCGFLPGQAGPAHTLAGGWSTPLPLSLLNFIETSLRPFLQPVQMHIITK